MKKNSKNLQPKLLVLYKTIFKLVNNLKKHNFRLGNSLHNYSNNSNSKVKLNYKNHKIEHLNI